jgi:type III secretory pathway component EscS
MKTKILPIILLVVINMIFFNINKVYAAGISDVISGGDSFIDAGKGESMSIDYNKLESGSKSIYNILLVLGICIAVIISAILGIKFMIGSAEEKAQIKDSIVPFIIGCIVVFGAFGFWKIFVTIGNNL